MSLNGKVALVTGASRGLGEGAARALAKEGAKVMLMARDGETVRKVAREIGGQAQALACDVSDYPAVERAVADTRQQFGGLDILVNNAGVIEPIAEIASSDPVAWARNIQINLVGAYNVVRAVLDGMLQTGGSIINVSSGAAHRPLEGWSAYCAAKAGLAMLTRSIALETAGRVRIFGFSPGTIDTDMQVKIRASGLNQVSQIPRANLSPVEHAVRGLAYLCDGGDDLMGQDVSMRDETFRKRIGLE